MLMDDAGAPPCEDRPACMGAPQPNVAFSVVMLPGR
jgi:hypothetical protein